MLASNRGGRWLPRGVIQKDLAAAGCAEGVALQVKVLLGGAYAGVADDHERASENAMGMGLCYIDYGTGNGTEAVSSVTGSVATLVSVP